ncbi:UDP-N-acetylglucosamine 1-carboxyvinyltransferase [Inquilinus limosus]|uniref:UDP-N-acetylglucosamine 1-carboxyvinyltransferase n=1 Tax=Inquilinus limosus TaxID=171674 RepID=UPI003F1855FE
MSRANVVSFRRAAPWWIASAAGRLEIDGGVPLKGEIAVAGAKNAALPLMVCAALTDERLTLRNLPRILDVAILAGILAELGVEVSWDETGPVLSGTLGGAGFGRGRVDSALVARMRASFLIAGAALARLGRIALPLPGGDAIGLRPVDFHLAGFRQMGATAEIEGGEVVLSAPNGLHGAPIVLPFPSVGATQNLMLAATLAKGQTSITNAAREPEVTDLARCLAAMGARIDGIGTDTLHITGVDRLHGATYDVLPDRIELGTLICAATATGGALRLTGAPADLLSAALPVFEGAGIEIESSDGAVLARRGAGGLMGVDIMTQPYPGFATDLQPQAMALLSCAEGAAMVTETLFENRFRHVPELQRMGANIRVVRNHAVIRGVPALHGAEVTATDIRAGAGLLIAALAADGTSTLHGVEHVDRGYDTLVERLRRCGARIRRVDI